MEGLWTNFPYEDCIQTKAQPVGYFFLRISILSHTAKRMNCWFFPNNGGHEELQDAGCTVPELSWFLAFLSQVLHLGIPPHTFQMKSSLLKLADLAYVSCNPRNLPSESSTRGGETDSGEQRQVYYKYSHGPQGECSSSGASLVGSESFCLARITSTGTSIKTQIFTSLLSKAISIGFQD